ncbi:MAG TPA: PspC domain-containing protein [Micromonospora sp.]|nr:PspC domain-containing protein [Micromonospora sp.]
MTDTPPPGTGTPPPPGYGPPPAGPPPTTGGAFAARYNLVRPQQGRYLAGVCAAIGRATGTDPILWRVLLAVLGFFGGIGILVYVAAWLIIPAEGDPVSPLESMLGRGRSSMAPLTVILLSLLFVLLFGFILADQFRAVVLAAAILIGGILLINRNNNAGAGPSPGPVPPAGPPTPPTGPTGQADPGHPAPSHPAPPTPTAAPQPSMSVAENAGLSPISGPLHPIDTAAMPAPPASAPVTAARPSVPPQPAPPPGPSAPPGGYRPPFAPHGPYAGDAAPHGPYPPPPPRPPQPPRERSPLGAVTFSMILVAIGVVALLDLGNAIDVKVSTYVAAALVTIALGLLVGTWFGRARWLIALGLVVSLALGISTVAESQQPWRGGEVVWNPAGYDELASHYEVKVGEATLDLTRIDFTDRDAQVSVRMNFGDLTVIVPRYVDVTVSAEVQAGDAEVFDKRWSGFGLPSRELTDLGEDGPGGGSLRLSVHLNVGDLEVRR